MYTINNNKKGGISARKVMDLVTARFGVSPTARDTQCYVKDGLIGQHPLKKGRADDLSPFVYNALCTDFDSYQFDVYQV